MTQWIRFKESVGSIISATTNSRRKVSRVPPKAHAYAKPACHGDSLHIQHPDGACGRQGDCRRYRRGTRPAQGPAGAVDKATEAAGALLDCDAARTRSAIQFATETSDFDGRSLQLEEEQCR